MYDNFCRATITKEVTIGDRVYQAPYTRYTCESPTALYIIDIRNSDGSKEYRINMSFAGEVKCAHRAIENHFNI